MGLKLAAAAAAAIAAAGLAAPSHGAPVDDLRAFASSHAGQRGAAPAPPGRRFEVRATIATIPGPTISPDGSALVFADGTAPTLGADVDLRCRRTGSFRGQNSYGATATVRTETCIALRVTFSPKPALAGVRADLTPAAAAAIQAGQPLEVVLLFEVNSDPARETVVRAFDIDAATIQRQVERAITSLDVLVTPLAISLPRAPGAPAPLWAAPP